MIQLITARSDKVAEEESSKSCGEEGAIGCALTDTGHSTDVQAPREPLADEALPMAAGAERQVSTAVGKPRQNLPDAPTAKLLVAFLDDQVGWLSEWILKAEQNAEYLLGVASNADIQIPSTRVSRRHGVISFESGKWFYQDIGSTNGSSFREEPLTTKLHLVDGDIVILAGEILITLVREGRSTGQFIERIRLLNQTSQPAIEDEATTLPFPIAVHWPSIRAAREPWHRLQVLIGAIEATIRFMTIVMYCELRDGSCDEDRTALAAWLSENINPTRPVSMGAWAQALRKLSQLVQPTHATFSLGKALLLRHGDQSCLGDIDRAVALRNRVAHGGTSEQLPDSAIEEHLYDTFRRLCSVYSRTTTLRVFTPEGVSAQDEESSTYQIRTHIGPVAIFPSGLFTSTSRFLIDWLYGLNGEKTFSLAPFYTTRICPVCRRLEVFFAPTLAALKPGEVLTLVGVTTLHQISLSVPRTRGIETLAAQYHPPGKKR